MKDNVITREDAVGRLRRQLIAWKEEGKSVCQIAAEKDVLCRGYHRDGDDELRRRYAPVIQDAPQLTREQLEQRANSWKLERQQHEERCYAATFNPCTTRPVEAGTTSRTRISDVSAERCSVKRYTCSEKHAW